MSAASEEVPPDDVWPLLVDAHCHPTDDPRPWKGIDVISNKLAEVQVGRVCAMSTSVRDQQYVSQLAHRLPHKIVPAFGYHPWFVHLISCKRYESPKDHYRDLFKGEKAAEELEPLLQGLPDPIPLESILADVRSHLDEHPNAILGEVGIDRAFRLPADPRGWTREPDNPEESHTLSLRDRPLTNLDTPIDHQLRIIKDQIAIAIDLRRSVSMHSVRAGGATYSLLEDLKKSFPSAEEGLNKAERKARRRDGAQQADLAQENDSERARCFQSINVDLHSCTISAAMISQLQRKHPNLYVSFSTAINGRQKDLEEQLLACDPQRLLIESDHHSAEDLGVRCWQMVRLATDVLGEKLVDMQTEPQARYREAAKIFGHNWDRFIGRPQNS